MRIEVLKFSDLEMLEEKNYGGAEKDVYKVTDGQRICAAKIYRTKTDSNAHVNREKAATVELETANKLRQTQIKPYIPTPYFLISGQRNNITGLALEWHNGDELEYRLFLDPDSYSQHNICFAPTDSPRLWLAECKLTHYKNPAEYERTVRKIISEIIEEFAV